ncbi:spindle defective 2 [Xylocopa sonorina]|uniref:spindle defective 2 n=1 Tax=Xylocopa sonorina TaxID=1818115 RepID=UPI00403AF108
MFTPPKSTGPNFINETVLNTPEPQAASTVQRKSTLESQCFNKDVHEAIYKQSMIHKNDATQRSDESSLGILNISSFLAEVSGMGDVDKQSENKLDTERELARKLLKKCSDTKSTSTAYDTNKENNANIQNLSTNMTSSLLMNSGQTMYTNETNSQNENTLQLATSKTNSIVFEPNEISARSSGLSRNSEKRFSSLSSKNLNKITFDTTTAELMAQFGNEEFRSASEMASQMLADEVSWHQNYSYALPTTTSTDKEYLNLSCFSGIIGELDLSVESCAGRKVSVGEFFKRKCGNFGRLSEEAVERPSLGLSVNSPKKRDQLIPLVDSTIATEDSSVASYAAKDKAQNVPNAPKDIESIMSLTSIAQALEDIDNGTPRRLVDQLIMAKKKKKSVQVQEEKPVRDTYIVPSSRKSMPATPSAMSIDNFSKDVGLINLSTKLSLDSKMISETVDAKHSIPRMLSFDSNAGTNTSFVAACHELKKEISNRNLTSYNQDFKMLLEDPKLTLPNYAMGRKTSPRTSTINSILNQEKISVDLQKEEMELKENIKEENISYKDKSATFTQDLSNLQGRQSQINSVIIGESTEKLCNCIVGISREADIELLNKSDKWVICSLSINQIQGDKNNVQLILPSDVILIKPNAEQHVKIAVTVVKMCKPIIAVLDITMSDMVTRSEWTMKHIIRFKPEEIDIVILNPSQKKELDFQCVVENSMAVLPVTIKNKNSIDVPIQLFISQDGSTLFSFENSEGFQHTTLHSQEVFTTNIQCKGILQKTTETEQRLLHRYNGTLIIQAKSTSDDSIIIQEIPLAVQVGTCKIQVIDTDLPLIVPNKQSKPLMVINLGTMPTLILASFSQDIESPKNSKYFSVEPKNLVVQPNDTGCFVVTYKQQNADISQTYAKIKLTTASSVHHYSVIGESIVCSEAENENLSRCETPQNSRSVSSPSSPHSVTSTKSGRNSPLSLVSSSTVAGDKIPIRTTHAALVWNSVRTGKSEIKEFTIRNISNNKIKIQAVISDSEKNFRFLRDRQAVGTSILLVLQGMESRTLSVIFSPHHIGAAAGKIIFKHYEPKRGDSESRPSKVLFLYGYGGYSKVEISEAFKDTSGKMWLSLGTLNSGGSLNAKIKLQNTGDLCSYVKIKLTPKAVYPTMVSSWQVNPTELLLNPKEAQWVTLEFHPRKEDLALLQRSDVSHVGTLLIIHGDEPSRWRIRRLYHKIKETGELSGNENEAFRSIVYPICRAFAGEQLISDISIIRDSVQNLRDLCQGIRQHEVMLTMEMCADETLSVLQDNADESQMFYSLCSDNSHIYEGHGESFLPSEMGDNTVQNEINTDYFIVSPPVVLLNPPTRTEAVVTIKSSCTVAQPFETSLSCTEYLSVVPAEGMIPTRRDFQLKIQCIRKIERNLNAILEIYTENNKIEVQIRVNVKRS